MPIAQSEPTSSTGDSDGDRLPFPVELNSVSKELQPEIKYLTMSIATILGSGLVPVRLHSRLVYGSQPGPKAWDSVWPNYVKILDTDLNVTKRAGKGVVERLKDMRTPHEIQAVVLWARAIMAKFPYKFEAEANADLEPVISGGLGALHTPIDESFTSKIAQQIMNIWGWSF
ncbi:hypothetical protein CY34DRAFT_108494 [Suillus luteus UH-Slu-Lm8-n1]|uniref:Uncharacterized protein n=1 Tax=Suillus luteus UH-Slu-Lm8-n1 TaxID=930992 RepID=A0A0D0AWT9_9AGAM|nr:hypothetical protein CY34DRAFT_108494 [Suillus luteus UH-Slu-Lm8-n1]